MPSRFPYTDFNKLNLDWIMRRLKEQVSSAVNSVNGKTGVVTLDATDVGALPTSTPLVSQVNNKTGNVTLDASDVGALPDTYTPPVTSVNSKTGAVVLDYSDVGALPDNYTPPVTSVNGQTGTVALDYSDVNALPDNALADFRAGTYTNGGLTWYYIQVFSYVVAIVSSSESVTGATSGTAYYGTGAPFSVPANVMDVVLAAGLCAGTGSQAGIVNGPKRLVKSGSTYTVWVSLSEEMNTTAAWTAVFIGTKS